MTPLPHGKQTPSWKGISPLSFKAFGHQLFCWWYCSLKDCMLQLPWWTWQTNPRYKFCPKQLFTVEHNTNVNPSEKIKTISDQQSTHPENTLICQPIQTGKFYNGILNIKQIWWPTARVHNHSSCHPRKQKTNISEATSKNHTFWWFCKRWIQAVHVIATVAIVTK